MTTTVREQHPRSHHKGATSCSTVRGLGPDFRLAKRLGYEIGISSLVGKDIEMDAVGHQLLQDAAAGFKLYAAETRPRAAARAGDAAGPPSRPASLEPTRVAHVAPTTAEPPEFSRRKGPLVGTQLEVNGRLGNLKFKFTGKFNASACSGHLPRSAVVAGSARSAARDSDSTRRWASDAQVSQRPRRDSAE